MDETLLAASSEGNIDALYRQIEMDPEFLDSINKVPFVHTPLHVAAEAGQTHFAIEMMTLMPSFARKLNPQGLSPLHLAVIEKPNEAVQDKDDWRRRKNKTAIAMIKLDAELVQVRGRERMTPLHHAVRENDLDLLAEFLCECPASIDDLTTELQSAVHIAVKERKNNALEVLLGWLLRRGREDVLGFQDEYGNTALHIAVETEQAEVVKKLIERDCQRHSINSNNFTALAIAEQKNNTEIKNILQRGGCKSAKILPPMKKCPEFLRSKESSIFLKLLRLFINMEKEMSLDMRNVLLVVAALVVTATFQGVLQPPGGLWQGSAAEIKIELPISSINPTRANYFHARNFLNQHSETIARKNSHETQRFLSIYNWKYSGIRSCNRGDFLGSPWPALYIGSSSLSSFSSN